MERMTPEAYRTEREALRRTYGTSDRETLARRDQALADLYRRSGWTQEKLAEEEHLSRLRILQLIRFGRFINWATADPNVTLGNNVTSMILALSESTFRKRYWEHTNKNAPDQERYEEIVTMLTAQAEQPDDRRAYRTIALALKRQFGDGRWHGLPTLRKALPEVPVADLRHVLDLMCQQGLYKVYGERQKAGTTFNYRLVIHEGTRIRHLDVFLKELQPILDGLEEEGKKNQATAVPAAVAELHFKLTQLIKKLAQ